MLTAISQTGQACPADEQIQDYAIETPNGVFASSALSQMQPQTQRCQCILIDKRGVQVAMLHMQQESEGGRC